MALGMKTGLDQASFSKAVKSMKLVVVTGEGRREYDLPLAAFDVPIYGFKVAPEPQVTRMRL